MEKLLVVENLIKSFGGLIAVNGISFYINPNEVLGLIGPNGSGKTTIFNLITGLYQPSSKESIIKFKEENITGLKPYERVNRGICRSFQGGRVFPNMTVLENAMIGQHSRMENSLVGSLFLASSSREEEKNNKEYALQMLEFTNLYNKKDYLAKNLNYCEHRMLEFTTILSSNPELLLLDEPTAGLNSHQAIEYTKLIDKLREEKKKTFVVIEHNMKVIMNISDRIIVFNEGKKITEGLPNEIANNKKVIKIYLGKGVRNA